MKKKTTQLYGRTVPEIKQMLVDIANKYDDGNQTATLERLIVAEHVKKGVSR